MAVFENFKQEKFSEKKSTTTYTRWSSITLVTLTIVWIITISYATASMRWRADDIRIALIEVWKQKLLKICLNRQHYMLFALLLFTERKPVVNYKIVYKIQTFFLKTFTDRLFTKLFLTSTVRNFVATSNACFGDEYYKIPWKTG